jgi:NIMA (never in mitosis gene a)-related kinase
MNNFELISKLGEGSYSTVYKVRRKADLKMYALKKVKLKNLSEKEKQNALNEIRILASIKSDHIITYKEAFIEEKEKILCLVTEFANKGDLFQKITYFKQMQKSFEEKDIWNIFIQILQGLKCLHDHNILHRDLKSANIFLFNNNLAKIGDLNVSKVTKNGIGHTQTGTPYYASPEVWNDESYTNKSDIWSLGCVLYEMICLTPPFKAESMDGLYHKIIKGKYNKIPEKYSKELNEILKLLFNVNPKERPSCDELLKNSIIKNKIEFFEENNKFNDDINNNEESELLKTIKISKNLLFLSGRLPKANYNNENEANNIKTLDNNKLLIKSITSINEEKKDYILPTIKLKNIQMLKKNIKLKKLNVFTEPTINKNEENIIKNKNKNLILNSSPNKITQSNENKIYNNAKSQRNKRIIVSNLLRNKGMNNLYKMYVSKDFMQKIESPNKKYALYLPKIFTRKKVKEKNQDNNNNSLIEEKSN